MSAMTVLEALRDALATVTGVVTCKIGIEANMTPDDYPMVRIVPSKLANSSVMGRRRIDVLVYFGKPIHEFTAGLEDLYSELFDMEQAIIMMAETGGAGFLALYSDTITDEDRVDGFKLLCARFTVEG